MLLDFERYAQKGNHFINQLMTHLDTTDRTHAARILKNTFCVLRNHLMVEESFQLISQLPMAIKSVYVDGWQIRAQKKIKTIDDFLIEMVIEEGDFAWRDFNSKEQILKSVRAVMDTLRLYVSKEEINQALGTLPEGVRVFLEPEVIH